MMEFTGSYYLNNPERGGPEPGQTGPEIEIEAHELEVGDVLASRFDGRDDVVVKCMPDPFDPSYTRFRTNRGKVPLLKSDATVRIRPRAT